MAAGFESMITRRQVLAAGVAAGAASLIGCAAKSHRTGTPATTTTCIPRPTAPGGLNAIEHVVIVIQENRSFDHYFGSYRGVRGFDDHPPGSPGAFTQPTASGRAQPCFHLDTTTTNASCTNDVDHDWAPQHRYWNNGAMDGWAAVHALQDGADGPVALGYYARADLPYYYALADAFTVCDAYHCSVMGPTDPNRLYSMSASVDPDGTHGGPVVATEDFKTATAAKFSRSWTTMPERLSAQGVSWKVYQQTGFETLPAVLALSSNTLFYFRQFADPHSDLYRQAFLPDWPRDFTRDVATGNLPSVSWVLSPIGQDEHPPSSPQVGEYFTSQVLAALMANPAVWAKTVVFMTYDENGGFFDHVTPLTPPPGTAGEYLTVSPLPSGVKGIQGPIGLGFRVPMLVLSPFSRGGWVSSERCDHTSTLRFLETRFGVEVPNLSAWRRSVTGDLTSALDLSTPDLSVPALPTTSLTDPVVVRECPPNEVVTPVPHYPVPASPPMPAQEPGLPKRHPAACAVPR